MTIVLSPEQQAIVDAPGGPLRIDAGAGTGKTFTLVRLVAEWVNAGTPPERILGITFTNKAAAELASRIRREVASAIDDAGMEVDVHTYHGFAGRLLAEFGPLVGIERGARILTPPLARQLLTDCLHLVGPLPDLDFTALSQRIQDAVTLAGGMSDNLVAPADLQRHDPSDDVAAKRAQLAEVVAMFEAEKRRLGVIDYGDMIAFAHRLVTEVPGAAERIRERYDRVLLDEYQDTAPAQRQLLQALFADGMTVVAVGDADQTIYEWRGASLENFAEFPDHFPTADGTPAPTLPLTVNRRSGQRILDVANAVRAHASDAQRLPLVAPEGTPPGHVTVGRYRTAIDEAAAIADLCLEHNDGGKGVAFREMAVLVRRNRDIARIREALADAGVPAEVATLGGLLEVPEVVDVHAWLRILDDPGDTVAFARLAMGARLRLGLADLKPLADWVRPDRRRDDADVQRTHVEALDHLDEFHLRDAARDALTRLRTHIHRLTPLAHVSSVVELVRAILTEIDAWRDVEALPLAQALSARLNLYRFLDLAQEWSPLEGQPTLTDFLHHLEVLRESPGEELETARISGEDTVTLLTVHRAKGLEWDVVFLPALATAVFPATGGTLDNPLKNYRVVPFEQRLDRDALPPLATIDEKQHSAVLRARQLAGEWRLGYVAVTRARRHLHASTAAWYGDIETTTKPKDPSDLFEVIAATPGVHRIADQEPGERPVTLKVDDRMAAPDPVFAGGWGGAVRTTLTDPTLPHRLAEEHAVTDDFETELAGFQGMLFSLPEPVEAATEPPAPAVSVSGLVTWAQCPRRFHHSFVDPLPRRPNPAAMRGVAVHRRIELHNLGRVPLEEADETRYDTIETDVEPGFGTDPALGPDPHTSFMGSRFAAERPLLVEAPFELRRSGSLIRGRIDAIYGDRHQWEIVDFKSGRPHDDPALDVQLDTYAVAASEGAVSATVPERVRVTFAFLGGGLTERSWEVDDERLGAARQRIDGILDGIVAGEADPTPNDGCERCDFLVVCPEGQAHVAQLTRG